MSLIEKKILSFANFENDHLKTVAISQDGTTLQITLLDANFPNAIWAEDPVLGLPTDPQDNPHFDIKKINETQLEITAVYNQNIRQTFPFLLVALPQPGAPPMNIDPQLILEPNENPMAKTRQRERLAATSV